MRNSLAAVLVGFAGSDSALAQTVNVACMNDYYVNTFAGPRYPAVGTPCNPAASVGVFAGTNVQFVVDTTFAAGSSVFQFFAVGPCVPGASCLPSIACPIPPAGPACTTNQSADIVGGFLLPPIHNTLSFGCQSSSAWNFVFPVSLVGATLSTQVAILPIGGHCAQPSGFAVTEAYNIQIM